MQSTIPSTDVPLSPALAAAFATVPDPRGARGKRFPLVAMRNLAVAAILANHLSALAIAEWGAAQVPAILYGTKTDRVKGENPQGGSGNNCYRTQKGGGDTDCDETRQGTLANALAPSGRYDAGPISDAAAPASYRRANRLLHHPR